MNYFTKYDYTIIRRHWIILLFRYMHFFLFIFFSFSLVYISFKFSLWIPEDVIKYIIFPVVFIFVNYAFIKLFLAYVSFYNNLIIIYEWQLIVVNSTLLFVDDIEFLDILKATKIDTYCRWIIPNLLNFWKLVIEQQREQVRAFHCVPDLSRSIQIINDEKQRTIEEWKKTYLVSKSNMKK